LLHRQRLASRLFRRVGVTVLAMVATLVTINASRAQSSHSVAGIVTEGRSGEAVIGAAVALFPDTSLKGKPVRGAITNKFGFYSMAGVPEGTYQLVVRSLGYGRLVREVKVDKGSVRLDLQLVQESIAGGEVTVEGQKESGVTRRISSIDVKPEMLQHLPSFGGETDIFRALQLLPGVKSSSEVSSGLYVRGGSPDQNLTLLDGVIVYNPSHLAGFMSTFNSDAIQDIHLIKGAFPAEYGGRLSSVLDLTMKEGTKEKVTGTAGVSLINSRLTVEGPLTENSTWMISGRRMYLDLVLLATSEQYRREAPRYYFYDLNGKVNYRLNASDRLFVSGYFGRDVLSVPQSADDSTFADIHWGNSTLNLRWSHIFSPEMFVNMSGIYTDYGFTVDLEDRSSRANPDDNFKSVSGVKDYMLRAEGTWFPHPDHTVKFGTEATEHRFRADASADIGDFGRIDAHPTILNSIDIALFGQDEWRITPLLNSNIGVRGYYFEKGNYFRLEPRLAFAYTVADNTEVTAAFSLGNQFLHLITRNDIALPTDVWFPSTATIKPESALQGVLGYQTHLFDNAYLFSVEGYYKSMKNLYEYKDTASFSLNVPLESSFTSGTGEAYGVEVFLNKQVGSFTGWIGYTLSWTKRFFPELNNGKPFYPRYDQRHDIQATITYALSDTWEFGASWVYATGQAYTVPIGQYSFPSEPGVNNGYSWYDSRLDYTERNGYRLPAFHKLDLNFTNKFTWFGLPWQFSINVYNAYNHKNVFAQYLQRDYSYYDNNESQAYKIHRVTLFPIIPTFGLSCKF
jgi:hypothetical protein